MARATTLSSVLIAANGIEGPKWLQAGDSSTYVGYCVEYEDADEFVVAATNSANLLGVAGCPSYHDNTAVFAAGARAPIWMKGCGAEVWVTHDGTAGNGSVVVEMGIPLTRSNSTAGLVEIDAALDLISIGFCARTATVTGGTALNIRCLLL